MNQIFDLLGFLSGVIFCVSFIPQIIKIIKTKSVKDISYLWLIFYILGMSLNLCYSTYYKLYPMMIPGYANLLLIIILTLLKYYYN